MSKYKHEDNVHNLESPRIIIPELIKLFQPRSIVDFGCGIGTFLKVAKENGVEKILGLDGPWVKKDQLSQYIDPENFLACDLEGEIKFDQNFDLAISLEVAEHLHPDRAHQFIKNIVASSDIVVFGAAIPFQGGQNHLNEQWPSYWAEIFQKHGYQQYDIFRSLFWENDKVFTWYKQNTFVYSRLNLQDKLKPSESMISKNFIHPDMYHYKAKTLHEVMRGEKNFLFYVKLLLKSFLR
jgi:SAM-dependent methyltransferase